MEHGRLVLLGACSDEQIGDREAVSAFLPELPVGRHRGQDRLGVDPQIAKGGQSLLDIGVVAGTASAVEHLDLHDRAHANLPELECLRGGSLQCRLVSEQQAA
jgi:hypothetical protein